MTELTGTAALIMADLDRDHITPMVRRCIERATEEVGRGELGGREYAIAELAAKLAIRDMAESMVDMRPLVERCHAISRAQSTKETGEQSTP